MIYILDADKNKATWATYDTNLDEWTKTYLGQNPRDAAALSSVSLPSKYNSGFTFTADAPMKVLSRPVVEFLKDSVVGGNRHLKIRITPTRKVNRYDVLANEAFNYSKFQGQWIDAVGTKGFQIRTKRQRNY